MGDIPESAFVSNGFSYKWLEPNIETLSHMLSVSPIALADSVNCPVFLAISKFTLLANPMCLFCVFNRTTGGFTSVLRDQ